MAKNGEWGNQVSKYRMAMDTDPTHIPGMIMSRIQPGSRVLEFGCAEGRMTRYMRDELMCAVSIVEIDEDAYRIAREYAADGFCGDIDLGTWKEYFSGQYFDFVIFADVLEHLRNSEEVLSDVKDFLSPGGEVLISLPNIAHSDIISGLYNNRFHYTETGLLDNTHLHFWGKNDLPELAAHTGYSIILLDGVYQLPFHTEQAISTESVSKDLQTALGERNYNDVYQFFLVLQAKPWTEANAITCEDRLKKASPELFLSYFYWNTGDGYHEKNCVYILPELTENGDWVFFCAKIPHGCARVRFDPATGQQCIVRNVSVETNCGLCEIRQLNGVAVGRQTFFPPDVVAQMEFELPKDAQWFRLTANIARVFGDDYADLARALRNTRDERDILRLQAGELQDSLSGAEEKVRSSIRERGDLLQEFSRERRLLDEERRTMQNEYLRLNDERLQLFVKSEKLQEELQKAVSESLRFSYAAQQADEERMRLSQELQQLAVHNSELQEQKEQARQEALTLAAEKEQARQEALTLAAEKERAQQEAAQKIQGIAAENMQLAARLATVLSQLNCISDSQIWRMTAPLRKLLDAIKRTRLGSLIHKAARHWRMFGFRATVRRVIEYLKKKKEDHAAVSEQSSETESAVQTVIATVWDFAQECKKDGEVFLEEKLAGSEGKGWVLLVSHELDLTGAPVVLFYFAESLKKQGFAPIVLSRNDGALRMKLMDSSITTIVYPKVYENRFVAECGNLFRFIVACTTVSAPLVSQLNGTKIPVLWWIHEAHASYHPQVMEQMPESLENNIHVYCGGLYAEKVLKQYRSNYEVKQLLYYVPDYSKEFFESSRSELQFQKNQTIFALVGMQEWRKGQDIFVRAIRMLPEDVRGNSQFVFVGKEYYTPIRNEIRSLLEEYPNNVRYIPSLERDELAVLYKKMDCLVCTSRDDPMPVVVAEAMMMSKSIICSENTGSADILQKYNGGLVYRNDDPKNLAACLCHVAYNRGANLQPMNQRARAAYDASFSADAFEESVANVIAYLETNPMQNIPYNGIVSIVIPVYNGGKDLEDLVDMLKRQKDVGTVEVIVVDSGSSDASTENAEALGAKVIRISQTEFSHSYARNLGAKDAAGEYVLFMTQDAFPTGEYWISGLLQPILLGHAIAVSCKETPRSDCDLFGRLAIWLHSEYMGILNNDRIMSLPKTQTCDSLRRNGQLNDVTCLIDRGVFMKYQYQGNYAEDLDLGLRLIRDGYQIALLSSTQVIHSHTRPAYYHFKRCIVDSFTLKKILPEIKYSDLSAQTVANRIITAFCVAQRYTAKTQRHSVENEPWNQFCEWTGKCIAEEIQYVKKATKDEISAMLKQESYYCDMDFREVVKQLFLSYSSKYRCDPATSCDQEYYICTTLSRYFTATGDVFCEKRKQEICFMMFKHLGQLAGSLLGAYKVYHPDAGDTLGRVIYECSKGV